jgi:hypothetical protein
VARGSGGGPVARRSGGGPVAHGSGGRTVVCESRGGPQLLVYLDEHQAMGGGGS